MTQIVDRLRNPALIYSHVSVSATTSLDEDQAVADMKEAADEIERLRTAMENARRDLHGIFPRSQAQSVYKRKTDGVIKDIEAALNIQQRAGEK